MAIVVHYCSGKSFNKIRQGRKLRLNAPCVYRKLFHLSGMLAVGVALSGLTLVHGFTVSQYISKTQNPLTREPHLTGRDQTW